MATPEPNPNAPKAFISYSWDDDAHKEWVRQLAIRLRAKDGVDVTLDRWHAAPGDQIPAFMERAVRRNDFVIAICTPRFKERSDEREGGVGYEGDIMTANALRGGDKRKFIPVLRRGSWDEAAPDWLFGRAYIDLSSDPYSESQYEELLRTLYGAREEAPPIGPRRDFEDEKGSQASPPLAPVTPIVGSSTPQHQSSVIHHLDDAQLLEQLAELESKMVGLNLETPRLHDEMVRAVELLADRNLLHETVLGTKETVLLKMARALAREESMLGYTNRHQAVESLYRWHDILAKESNPLATWRAQMQKHRQEVLEKLKIYYPGRV